MIKKYLKLIHKSITAAADELGVTRPYLTDIVNGKRIPGRKLAVKIERWSDGHIKASDLLSV